jgi:predicted protein tyrosine phosphatase
MPRVPSAERPTKGTQVHVCPLAAVPEILKASAAAHLITVINAQTIPATPPGIDAKRHLKIAVNDIAVPQPGLIHPTADHIEQILAFAQEWDHQGPLVVHCWAGISRSTAAAFITLCALNEDGLEGQIARALRDVSKTATPNPLMVALADDYLGRRGRMVDAINAIGRGEMAMSGQPFSIPSRF